MFNQGKKYFRGNLIIRTGDIEENIPYAVEANELEKAYEIMKEYARNYYHGLQEVGDRFEMNCGEVVISYDVSAGIMTVEEWLKSIWDIHHIKA